MCTYQLSNQHFFNTSLDHLPHLAIITSSSSRRISKIKIGGTCSSHLSSRSCNRASDKLSCECDSMRSLFRMCGCHLVLFYLLKTTMERDLNFIFACFIVTLFNRCCESSVWILRVCSSPMRAPYTCSPQKSINGSIVWVNNNINHSFDFLQFHRN